MWTGVVSGSDQEPDTAARRLEPSASTSVTGPPGSYPCPTIQPLSSLTERDDGSKSEGDHEHDPDLDRSAGTSSAMGDDGAGFGTPRPAAQRRPDADGPIGGRDLDLALEQAADRAVSKAVTGLQDQLRGRIEEMQAKQRAEFAGGRLDGASARHPGAARV